MDIPKQAYDRVCQFCGQTVAERMLLTSHELYCAKTKLTQCQERLAVAEKILSEVISQNKRILKAIDKISHWVNPAEVNIQFVLSEINTQANAFLGAKP